MLLSVRVLAVPGATADKPLPRPRAWSALGWVPPWCATEEVGMPGTETNKSLVVGVCIVAALVALVIFWLIGSAVL